MEISINGISYHFQKPITILQACQEAGEDIPNFCYHEKLQIAGNCRMCLVEVEGSPKPVSSCTLTIQNNMKIHTKSPLVKKAQQNVMESLLYLHPLDCPICDQGGECDLQEQNFHFGNDRGRFYGDRRGVEDKNCGPLIKTVMTRCIHCTRCVRFSSEIAGEPFFGTLKRGTYTEISPYKIKPFTSEISGNVIDLCPVGALTSKPHAFQYRSWEETNEIESFDIFDSFFSNILISTTNTQIYKILPNLNNKLNKEWISDKARFSFDSYDTRRITDLYIFSKKKRKIGAFTNTSWEFFSNVLKNKKNLKIKMKIGELVVDNLFFNHLNLFYFLKEDTYKKRNLMLNSSSFQKFFSRDFRVDYTLNFDVNSIKNFENLLLCSIRLKRDYPILNSYIYLAYKKGFLDVYCMGSSRNLNYKFLKIGNNIKTFFNFLKGKTKNSTSFLNGKINSIFFGSNLNFNYNFQGFNLFLKYIQKNHKKYYGPKKSLLFYEIQDEPNSFLYKEFITNNSFFFDFIENKIRHFSYNSFIINKKKYEFSADFLKKNFFLNSYLMLNFNNEEVQHDFPSFTKFISIFMGSHGEVNAKKADFILPLTLFYEKPSVEGFNMFGFEQRSYGFSKKNSFLNELFYLFFFNQNLFNFLKKDRKNNTFKNSILDQKTRNITLNRSFSVFFDNSFYLNYSRFFLVNFEINRKNSYKSNHLLRNSKNILKSDSVFIKQPF